MNWTEVVIIGIVAYLLGSIPTAVWISKWFFKKDIRKLGSGNAGFSNTLRVFGPKAGVPVLIIDVAKGFFAVFLYRYIDRPDSEWLHQLIPVSYGILAFIGHLIPIFAGFKGGKGVATGLGIIIALFPQGALIALGVFLFVIFTFRMMGLGSMVASLSLPVSVYFYFGFENLVLLFFSSFISLTIIFTHRSNIKRMKNGTENRIWFRKPKNQDQEITEN